jgi:FkbM family methyltransferase
MIKYKGETKMTLLSLIRGILSEKMKENISSKIDEHPLLFGPMITLFYHILLIPVSKKKAMLLSATKKVKIYTFSNKDSWNVFHEIYYEQIYGKTKREDVVIDVGANVGMFTIKSIKEVGNDGLVIAIEPEPRNLVLLRKNTKIFNNVIVVPKAVGDSKRKIKLFIANTSGGHSIKRNKGHGYIEVEIDLLDNIISELGAKRVDFIKIDVEGAEKEVLEGAKEILLKFHPKIALEYHSIQNMQEVSRILTDLGYLIEVAEKSKLKELGYIYGRYK